VLRKLIARQKLHSGVFFYAERDGKISF